VSAGEPEPPHAVVRSGGLRRTLYPGESLTFGRGQHNDIPLGRTPPDLRVPRSVGRLECREDMVLVHNVSNKITMLAETFPGPNFEIPPLMTVGSLPHTVLTLVVRGEGGARHVLQLDCTRLSTAWSRLAPAPPTSSSDETVGFARLTSLTTGQREILLALCLPAFLGEPITPSYTDMEAVLRARGRSLSAKTIRNSLDQLRRHLATDHDVPDVYSEQPDDPRGGKQSFLPQLARWARLSGNVTDDELTAFEDRDVGGRR
jgi:hypothetical protein